MQQHRISVARTARYYTLGKARGAHHVWFVCHGYGQLAAPFLSDFTTVAHDQRLLVAPEASSRFYRSQGSGDVGASWMTKEDRLTEIDDYVRYLDAVRSEVLGGRDRSAVRVTVLGFSQGAATAARWVALGTGPTDRLILWGGTLPPDLDLEASGDRLSQVRSILVAGRRDEFATQKIVERDASRLREHGIPVEVIQFDGGHRLDRNVLGTLAADNR